MSEQESNGEKPDIIGLETGKGLEIQAPPLQKATGKQQGFQPGRSGNPKGREPGSKNARTQEWEQFGRAMIEGNLEWMNEHVARLKEEDPAKAFALIMDVMEYFKPKLARTELKAPPGTEVTYTLKFK